MINFTKIKLLLGTLILSFSTISQENSINLGLQLGNLGNGANSLKNEVYFMNNVRYPNLASPISIPNYLYGFNVEFMHFLRESDRVYFFINWSNLHLTAKGEGVDSKTNQEVAFNLKYRHNNLNLIGFGVKPLKWLGIGYSPVDIGKLKVLHKNKINNEQPSKYDDFYNVEKGLLSDYTIYGSSYYLDFFIKRLIIRLGYYHSYEGIGLRDMEDILTQHHYNANRFTFSIKYMLKLSND